MEMIGRAQIVMRLANRIAERADSEVIKDEHILLAMLSDSASCAYSFLKEEDVDVAELRDRLEVTIRFTRSDVPAGSELSKDRTASLIELAEAEAPKRSRVITRTVIRAPLSAV